QTPPPPVREFQPEAPASLDPILQKALVKDPAGRYQTAEEMLGALRLAAAAETLERSMAEAGPERKRAPAEAGAPAPGGGGGGAPESRGRERLLIVLLATIAALATTGLIIVLLRR